jgi:hypothetical protein
MHGIHNMHGPLRVMPSSSWVCIYRSIYVYIYIYACTRTSKHHHIPYTQYARKMRVVCIMRISSTGYHTHARARTHIMRALSHIMHGTCTVTKCTQYIRHMHTTRMYHARCTYCAHTQHIHNMHVRCTYRARTPSSTCTVAWFSCTPRHRYVPRGNY